EADDRRGEAQQGQAAGGEDGAGTPHGGQRADAQGRAPRDDGRADRFHAHADTSILRRTIAMKNAAPMNASTTPTSSSPDGMRMRPTTSARVSRMAPAAADAGSSQRWSGPVKLRPRCGTMRPTKPIGPVAAVDAPARRATMAMPVIRAAGTFTPSPAE